MHISKLLLILFMGQVSHDATIYFSYLGVAERTDALGNPIAFLVGGFEPGHLTFQGYPSSLNVQDITGFSFTASLPDTDALGNPTTRIIEFDDLLLFSAAAGDGYLTNFTLATETTFSIPPDPFGYGISNWADGQVFRFSVMPDLSALLEAVSPGSTITVTEGTVSFVPEPEVFSLAMIGIVLLGARRRRASGSNIFLHAVSCRFGRGLSGRFLEQRNNPVDDGHKSGGFETASLGNEKALMSRE
jgi:hypothetical protein